MTPTPAMRPPLVFASSELANAKTSRRTSSWPLKDLFLEDLLELESLGDPECHGDDRDDGEQRVEGQRRGPQLTAVFLEGCDGGKKDPQGADAKGFERRKALRPDSPDVFLDKYLQPGDHPGALSIERNGRA